MVIQDNNETIADLSSNYYLSDEQTNDSIPSSFFLKYQSYELMTKPKLLGSVPTGKSCNDDDDCESSSNKCCKIKSSDASSNNYEWLCHDPSDKSICLDTIGDKTTNTLKVILYSFLSGILCCCIVACYCYCRCKRRRSYYFGGHSGISSNNTNTSNSNSNVVVNNVNPASAAPQAPPSPINVIVPP